MSNHTLIEASNIIARFLKEALIKELVKQGHVVTGELLDSIEVKVDQRISKDLSITGSFFDYGIPLDTGVPAENIPFNPGSGAGKSLYIEGLTRWVQLKGFESDAKDALGIAFAIAHTHKRLGMPVDKSKIGWMTKTLNTNEGRILADVERAINRNMNVLIDNIARDAQQLFNIASA